MRHIINKITNKHNWPDKLNNEKIVKKWIRELQEQGISKDVIDGALSILRDDFSEYYYDLDINYYYEKVNYIDENRAKHYNEYRISECEHCSKQAKLSDHIKKVKNLVSEDLRQRLIANVKILEDIPNDKKDWHPGSNNQVLDLVHPSLYCYVAGVSKFKNGKVDQREIKEGYRYQWLPAECGINQKSEAKFLSYINNLYKLEHRELYQVIEKIFARYIPYFEKILMRELPKRLQVIVKLANIILTEENPKYEGGVWHVEGMPYEHICASGIYYYESENIEDSYLEFRRAINEEKIDYEQSDDIGVQWHYKIGDGEGLNEELGSIRTTQGKSLIFPNYLQHKVGSFNLEKGCKEGKRKILVFFLIDPDKRIISTADVPIQQKEIKRKILAGMIGNRLPKDLINVIVKYMSGMTSEEAKKYRERLMLFRKYFIDELNEEVYERQFSLCEH